MTLEAMWAGWRMEFIANSTSKETTDTGSARQCVLCRIGDPVGDDDDNMVVARGQMSYVVLNIYPYTSAHLMVVPYLHTAEFGALSKECRGEMMDLVGHAVDALGRGYSPQGFNIGMNLGEAAGAGIAEHLHAHVVPRWNGDTNFMTTTASIRVLPEALSVTRERVRESW